MESVLRVLENGYLLGPTRVDDGVVDNVFDLVVELFSHPAVHEEHFVMVLLDLEFGSVGREVFQGGLPVTSALVLQLPPQHTVHLVGLLTHLAPVFLQAQKVCDPAVHFELLIHIVFELFCHFEK